MSPAGRTLASSRLGKLAQRNADSQQQQAAAEERCELCGELISPEHRHLFDLERRELMCSCRACSLLFDRGAAGGGHFRLVPDRRLRITDFELADHDWAELRIPVEMAFFFRNSDGGQVQAFYPSPMGATESALQLGAWDGIEAANPLLAEMQPDVEALLVNRSRGERDHWLVPIDECFALVGVIRMRWKGLSGGKEVWGEIDGFFEELGRRARHATREGTTKSPTTHAGALAAAGGEE